MNVSLTSRLRPPTHPSHSVPEEKLEGKVKVSLTTPRRRGCRGLAPLILKLDTRCRWVVNSTALPLYPRERTPVHTEQKIIWALEPVWGTWKREKLLFLAGIQTPDRPDRKLGTISILIRSNEMQQYAGVYLLQNYSMYLGCLSHPSSEVHQIVTAASGTGHSVRATIFPPAWPQSNNLPPAWPN